MKHVAPHKWADAWAGKLPDDERAAIDRHAAECPACTKVRERVTRASDSFLSIRNQQAPDVGWDSVRAKVHWSVSTERRAKIEPPASRAGWIAAGACALAGVAATMFVDRPSPPSTPDILAAVPAMQPVQDRPTTALVGLVNRTTGDLMIDGIRAVDPFAKRLAAGTVIATGPGRVDVQFGHASAFHLAPHSRLELVRFDDKTIELSIEGTIDITIAPRAAGQTFIVRAGARTISVLGTQFRIRHTKQATSVACRHGLVAVRDPRGQLEVGAARRVELPADRDITNERVVAMTVDEVTDLADATPITMPVWDVSPTASAPLDIATAGRHPVRLDGVELGEAPMRVRTTPGRHTVEVADTQGRYRRVGWVDVAPGATRPARIEIQPEAPPTPGLGINERRRQFRLGIDRGKIAACTRVAAKSGLIVGAYVQIEIAVDAQGAVGFLNLLETDMPRKVADCIDGVLKEVRFKPGPAASWREKIDL